MQQVNRMDPAPSRWAYRVQRWMLTPLYRTALRVGLPMALAFGAGGLYLSNQDRQDALRLWATGIKNDIQTRDEFMLSLMAVDGASDSVTEDIREIIPIDFPVSSFDINIDNIRQEIADLPAVKSVSVRIRAGGILQVTVKERVPAIVWRGRDGLSLLDENGFYVGEAGARQAHLQLPLIAGEGADEAAAEALAIFAATGPLQPRLRGLVRMGGRRWDVVLDRDQRILLPEDQPVQALERVIALHQAQEIMARDLTMVDMRIGMRPTIRMDTAAMEQWWQINKIGFKD